MVYFCIACLVLSFCFIPFHVCCSSFSCCCPRTFCTGSTCLTLPTRQQVSSLKGCTRGSNTPDRKNKLTGIRPPHEASVVIKSITHGTLYLLLASSSTIITSTLHHHHPQHHHHIFRESSPTKTLRKLIPIPSLTNFSL